MVWVVGGGKGCSGGDNGGVVRDECVISSAEEWKWTTYLGGLRLLYIGISIPFPLSLKYSRVVTRRAPVVYFGHVG